MKIRPGWHFLITNLLLSFAVALNAQPGGSSRLPIISNHLITVESAASAIVQATVVTKKRIAILGSSTAAGYFQNLWPIDSSYAKQLMHYYQQAGIIDTLYLFAANGENPYNAMPTWYRPDSTLQPANVYTYDVYRNITRTLTFHPDVILVHYPTNNFDVLTIAQAMFAFRTIKATADSAGVPVFFIGTQPRGNLSIANKQKLIVINDSLKAAFGSRMISYYDSVATAPRSLYMRPDLLLDKDSIHMNPKGHDIIFRQIIKANIFSIPSTPAKVNAGASQTIRLPLNSVTLSGTVVAGSVPVASTAWSQVSGPNTGLIQSPKSLKTLVNNLVAGTYSFKLTSTDNLGIMASSAVQITVLAAVPVVPATVSAGADQTIRLPQNSVTLSGTVVPGSIPVVSTVWSQASGPATGLIQSPGSLKTLVSNLVAGTYSFRLTSTDSLRTNISSALQVTVLPVIPLLPPVVSAGGNQAILLPNSSVTLSGTVARGSGGPLLSILWTQQSGPGKASIASPASTGTRVSGLVSGNYIFRLTATDSAGNTAYDNTAITLSDASSVNVRLFGGTAPFDNSQWNNWNVGVTAFQTPLRSGLFSLADGSPGTVYAELSAQTALADNGAGYAQNATGCPDSVLRFSSYFTGSRILTISGLDNAGKYDIELYASRSSTERGTTEFTVGTKEISDSTDNNQTHVAIFSSVATNNGSVAITISNPSAYNYLNGFKITRLPGGHPPVGNGDSLSIQTYPNPVISGNLTIVNNRKDQLRVEIFDLMGRRLMRFEDNVYIYRLGLSRLKAGTYVLVLTDRKTGAVSRRMILII